MSDKNYLDESTDVGDQRTSVEGKSDQGIADDGGDSKGSRLLAVWEGLTRVGLGETIYRLGTHLLSIALVLIVVWGMRAFYLRAQVESIDPLPNEAKAAALPTPTPTQKPPDLPEFVYETSFLYGIPRLALLDTVIPTRPRTEVITYTVQKGDTIFGIAEKFNLKPETILWGNTYILGDNPHLLQPGMDLNILPVDCTFHKWSAGEGLNGVSS